MRVDKCDFSGYKVYPSRGKVYVRGDSKVRIDVEGGCWLGRSVRLGGGQ